MPNPNDGLHAASAATCEPGYYLNNGTCQMCENGYYCTGGTADRVHCLNTIPAGSPEPFLVRSIVNNDIGATGASSPDHCLCDWYLSDETRWRYQSEYYCPSGPLGITYTKYDWCRTGYYATKPINGSDWYTACAPCDNAPAHAHYTSYSTPSVMYAVESNCPWACDAGYGRVGDACQLLCTTGVTALHAGAATAPLFPTPPSTPALVVRTAAGVCYGNLTAGHGAGLNVTIAGTTYHVE